MTDLGPGIECEIAGVPDTVPKAVRSAQKRKKRLNADDLIADVPPPEQRFTPVIIPDLVTQTPIDRSLLPIEYFSTFFTPDWLDRIALFTNKNAASQRCKPEVSDTSRPWNSPTNGAEIGVFIGSLLIMGLEPRGRIPLYWSPWNDVQGNTEIMDVCSPLLRSIWLPPFPANSAPPLLRLFWLFIGSFKTNLPIKAIGLQRWQQIKRYFKVSDLETDPNTASSPKRWLSKVHLLMTHLQEAFLKSIIPGKHVSIDEQLVKFKGRSKNTMMISTKVAGQGFKLYSLCVGNYLIWFKFTAKSSGIEGNPLIKGQTASGSVVLNLMAVLRSKHVVYIDNFFTSTKLLLALRTRGHAACGTCKRGSGINDELLLMREQLQKRSDWGKQAITTKDDQILCMAWQDNQTVLLMTTAHTIDEAKSNYPKDPKKRHNIPNTAPVWVEGQERPRLLFPLPVTDYNKHMGGSDGNAQQRACASPTHRDVRYWWPLFVFMLEASVLNAHILHKVNGGKDDHREFQRQIALELLRNPAGQSRKKKLPTTSDMSRKRKYQGPEHEWRHLPNRRYCSVCSANRPVRPIGRPLQSISTNQRAPKRPPQTIWGCSSDECIDLAICKPNCWEGAHL
jgi:hypothetical protein